MTFARSLLLALAAWAAGAQAAPDPFKSTYQPAASAPTLIRNATVLDGTGRRLDGADVLMRDGKIAAVGTGLAADGATVVDAQGRWVTPGLIDVHSHLGVYASPGVNAHQDGNEATAAGPGLLHGDRRGRDHAAGAARLGEPDRRPRRDAAQRRRHDHAGDEVPGGAAWPQDGLRRESEARVRRQGSLAIDAHGQRRRLPPGIRRRAGLPRPVGEVRARTRHVRGAAGRWQGPPQEGGRRRRASPDAEARPAPRDTGQRDGRRDPGAHPLLPGGRDGRDARPREGVRLQGRGVPPRRRGLQDRRPPRTGRRLRRAVGRLVGLQDGSLRRDLGEHRLRRCAAERLRDRALRLRRGHPAPEPGGGEGDVARPARGPHDSTRARDPLDHVERRAFARHRRRGRHPRARQTGRRRDLEPRPVQRLCARRARVRGRGRALRPRRAARATRVRFPAWPGGAL